MKRSFTIGRNPLNDIYIDDPSNVISRSHATIRVDGRKFFITDHSTNGTYRNGIKLTPGIEYPVTKDDEVSFGGLYTFDWAMIPKPKTSLSAVILYVVSILVLAALCIGAFYLLPKFRNAPDNNSVVVEPQKDTTIVSQPVDSLTVQKDDQPSKKEGQSSKPKKKETKAKRPAKSQPSESSISKKDVSDYSDSDDKRDVDAL